MQDRKKVKTEKGQRQFGKRRGGGKGRRILAAQRRKVTGRVDTKNSQVKT
jgi:hypothetical protein